MSGGAYGHLCWFTDEVFGREESVRGMADRVSELAPGSDAACELRSIVAALAGAAERLDKMEELLKAVEWYDSGDRGEEQAVAAIAEFKREPSDIAKLQERAVELTRQASALHLELSGVKP